MDEKELQKIIANDTIEHRKELVALLIEYKHKARGCVFKHLGWPNGFMADFERNGQSRVRNVLIVSGQEKTEEIIRKALECSSEQLRGNPVFSKLDCYVFGEIGNVEELCDYAEYQLNITLTIYDIKDITSQTIAAGLVRRYADTGTEQRHVPFTIDRNKKIIFDLFSTGATVAGIKNSFVSSYIQLALYDNEKLTPVKLKETVSLNLKNMSDAVFDSSLRMEMESDHVEYHDGHCFLKEDFKQYMDGVIDTTSATEKRLFEQFDQCLARYGLQDLSKKVMEKIVAIYQTHYSGEADPFNSHDKSEKREKTLYNALVRMILNKGQDVEASRKIANELLGVVGESEYLNKTSLTQMFTGMFNSGQLEEYMNRQQRIVVLDTQILLNLLCLLYQDVEYDDTIYDSTVMLWKQLKESKDYVTIYTTSGYVDEVAKHLCEAMSISRFLSLPYVRDLGKSKNVFFNFYLYLIEKEDMGFESFEDFIGQMLNCDDVIPNSNNARKVLFLEIINDIFEAANIQIKTLDTPEDYNQYLEAYKLVMNNCNMWYKNPGAINKDILCSYYLSDDSNFINSSTMMPETPFLVTLDRTMWPYMQSIVAKFDRKRYYVYPPVKFANRLSVMNMKIDSSKINYNVICLTENNYNANSETMSMMDIIAKLINVGSINDLETPRELAAIKREQQDDVESKDFATKNNDSMPIDVVLTDIVRHYGSMGKAHMQLLGRLFSNNEKTAALIAFLKKYCKLYVLYGVSQRKENMFKELDELIS